VVEKDGDIVRDHVYIAGRDEHRPKKAVIFLIGTKMASITIGRSLNLAT
jgi:hypothetical protein